MKKIDYKVQEGAFVRVETFSVLNTPENIKELDLHLSDYQEKTITVKRNYINCKTFDYDITLNIKHVIGIVQKLDIEFSNEKLKFSICISEDKIYSKYHMLEGCDEIFLDRIKKIIGRKLTYKIKKDMIEIFPITKYKWQ